MNVHALMALNLGVALDQVKTHPYWVYPYGQSIKYSIWLKAHTKDAMAAIQYLKNRPEGQSVSEAMQDVLGCNRHQIRAILMGIRPDQARLQKHWGVHAYTTKVAMEYLKNCGDKPIQVAMDEISGLYAGDIQAVQLGLSKQNLQNHRCGVMTIRHLKKRPDGQSLLDAFNEIRGLSDYEIEAYELGVSRAHLQEHDWSNHELRETIFEKLRKRPDGTSVDDLMSTIRGFHDYEVLVFFEKNLTRDMVMAFRERSRDDLYHDYESSDRQSLERWVIHQRAKMPRKEEKGPLAYVRSLGISLEGSTKSSCHRPDDLDTAVETVLYLEAQSQKGQSFESALADIRGLNSEAIKAVRMGLKREDVIEYDWSHPRSAYRMLLHLKECSSVEACQKAWEEIKANKPSAQTGMSAAPYSPVPDVDFSFLRSGNMPLPSWRERQDDGVCSLPTYFETRSEGVTIEQAMAAIKETDYYKLRRLGVSRKNARWLHDQYGIIFGHRERIKQHDWKDPEITALTLDFLENKPDNISMDEAMLQVQGYNVHQFKALRMGLEGERIRFDLFSETTSAKYFLTYLENFSPDTINDAFDRVRKFKANDIRALNLGFSLDDVLERKTAPPREPYEYYSDDDSASDDSYAQQGERVYSFDRMSDEVFRFLEYRLDGQDPKDALEEIEGLNPGGIKAVQLGLPREYAMCHYAWQGGRLEYGGAMRNFWLKDAQAALEHLRRKPRHLLVEAFSRIVGLNRYAIRAIGLGLTRQEVDRHGMWGVGSQYEICKQAKMTLKHLEERPSDQSVQAALEEICGLNTPEIRVVELGLKKEHLHDHVTRKGTVEYLKNRRNEVPIEEAMEEIRGLDDDQIEAVSVGLRKDQIHGHDWNDDETRQLSLTYLKIISGDLPSQEEPHHFPHIKRLDHLPKDLSLEDAMEEIRGLTPNQLRAILLGLRRTEIEGHDWDRTFKQAKRYLKERPGDEQTIAEAMNTIRGMSKGQILAALLGLKKKEMKGHDWSSCKYTIQYLSRKNNLNKVSHLMDDIRGLDDRSIFAMLQYGITRAQIEMSEIRWTESLREYLNHRPCTMDEALVFENALQMNYVDLTMCGNWVQEKSPKLLLSQIYIQPFTEVNRAALEQGKPFEMACPKAWISLIRCAKRSFLSEKVLEKLLNVPKEVASYIASFMTMGSDLNVIMVRKDALEAAERSKVLRQKFEDMDKNPQPFIYEWLSKKTRDEPVSVEDADEEGWYEYGEQVQYVGGYHDEYGYPSADIMW